MAGVPVKVRAKLRGVEFDASREDRDSVIGKCCLSALADGGVGGGGGGVRGGGGGVRGGGGGLCAGEQLSVCRMEREGWERGSEPVTELECAWETKEQRASDCEQSDTEQMPRV